MNDDQALASYVAQGNKHAFEQLIRKHERLVVHMVGRVVSNSEDLEEICQDVFLKVYEKISEFNFQSKLSTWIATIAYRQAINHLRKKRIKIADLPEDENFAERFIAHEDTWETIEDNDMEAKVMSLIDTLPPQYRVILTLYHLEDMNYKEIGEATGMPEGTVKNYLFRARQLLKEKVKTYLGKEV
ncbi:DNA-directed RNA polymerase sigma-70 factor [Cytophagales bacterium WSM2-2]|nr:DNA-directed RNA polymerase sigma-70 factor [Cytophagales bacterium WSM2-2]